MPRFRGLRGFRYANRVGQYMRAGRGRRQARFIRTRMKQRVSSGRGVTLEHDRQRIYRKKSMPRSKRRRWKRFSRKVNAVAEKELGSRTVVFNNSLVASNSTSGNQGQVSLALYGWESPSNRYSDLNYIGQLENTGDPTSAAGINVDTTTRMIFKSAVLDMTIRNTSTEDDGASISNDMTLETDIYEIVMSKYAMQQNTTYDNMGGILATQEKVINDPSAGAETSVDIDFRGVTPWDLTPALSQFGLKIMKKTKYFIRGGQTVTYQIRDPKRRVCTRASAIQNSVGCNKPGWTRHVLIIYKSIPGFTISSTVREQLTVGYTRKYLYKIEGANQDRSLHEQR